MVITDANPPYHIKHANSAWSRLTGFSAAFVKAKTMKILQASMADAAFILVHEVVGQIRPLPNPV